MSDLSSGGSDHGGQPARTPAETSQRLSVPSIPARWNAVSSAAPQPYNPSQRHSTAPTNSPVRPDRFTPAALKVPATVGGMSSDRRQGCGRVLFGRHGNLVVEEFSQGLSGFVKHVLRRKRPDMMCARRSGITVPVKAAWCARCG